METPFKKVLIAVDQTDVSANAVKKGIALAMQLKAQIGLVFVIDRTRAIGDPDIGTTQEDNLKMLHDIAKKTLNEFRNEYKTLALTTFIPEGHPVEDVLKTATEWNANLLVLGTHSRKGLAHFLLGSDAEQIERRAKVPVLIVPLK